MKRFFGSFLIIVGIVIGMYAFSAYNLYTASDAMSEIEISKSQPIFYPFFTIATISVIGGIALIRTDLKTA